MRVVIDATALSDAAAGGGNWPYVIQLARALQQERLVDDLLVVTMAGSTLGEALPDVRVEAHSAGRFGHGIAGRLFVQQLLIPRVVRSFRADVLHAAVETASLVWPGPRPVIVVTSQDMRYMHDRRGFGPQHLLFRRLFYAPAVRMADRIVTSSRASADDLVRYRSIQPELIDVAPLGVDDQFHPRLAEDIIPELAPLGVRPPFILGTANWPHKNADVTLAAYAKLAARRSVEHQLAFTGARGENREQLLARAETLGVRDRLVLLDFVPGQALPWLFAGADVFAFPSSFEGFGLPVLEAMASGTPVICSDRGSVPEVAGEAALVLSSLDPETWCEALDQVLGDRNLHSRLTHDGLARAATYTWRRTATLTRDAYAKALRSRRDSHQTVRV